MDTLIAVIAVTLVVIVETGAGATVDILIAPVEHRAALAVFLAVFLAYLFKF